MDFRVITLDPSGNELLESKVMFFPSFECGFELQKSDIPNQSFARDIPDHVIESSKKQLPYRVDKSIPWPTYKHKLSIELNIL